MSSLREKMALHGFESNDDYGLVLRCLLDGGPGRLRCLVVEGDCGRRKTAFASALAHALEYPRVLYHDFTQLHPPLPDVILPRRQDDLGREEPPLDPLDQIVSEACAFSEAEDTILILDQLQAADFREHIRLYRLLRDARWSFRDASYTASPAHLLVFLISEQPLYHSLQQLGFRVWVERVSTRSLRYRPEAFGLEQDARPLFAALEDLFGALACAPTHTEMRHLLRDLQQQVPDRDGLRQCLYGRIEGMDRGALGAPDLAPALDHALAALCGFLGADEVEVCAPP